MTWQPSDLDPWLTALKDGDVVAAPAEGVYGYCCDPFNDKALAQLNAIKERNGNKGFVTLVPDILRLSQICSRLSEAQLHGCYEHWKADQAITLVLPAKHSLPDALTGSRNTIAVRLPHSPYMLEYLKAWDAPLVSTSANLSGEPPITNPDNLPKDMTKLTLPEPLKGTVSKIFDATNGEFLR